jgi:hypothetical protein
MTDTPRPAPPPDEVPNHVWMAEVDSDWRLDEGRCRRAVSKTEGSRSTGPCRKPAVAALNRGRHNPHTGKRSDSWWRYCADHLYGRWIEDGQVMRWVLRGVPHG